MVDYAVDLFEPVTIGVTADSTAYTADATWPTADGGILVGATDVADATVNASFISAEIYEPIRAGWTADSTAVTADSTNWTADGGPLLGATDFTDAEVVSADLPAWGGGYYRPTPRPRPIVGRAYGVLPQLEGEAFGAVGVVGDAVATLPRLGGTADGVVGIVGRSAGRLIIHATAAGVRGQVGTGDAIFKTLNASASGRHDDDEAAAILTLLLAA